jgi:hypothetical protein
MNAKKKIVLTERDLMTVVEHSHETFMEVKGFADITPKQIQAACIIEGLKKFLEYKGIEPQFDLEEKVYSRGKR